jgi:hypothetical protein
LLSTRLTSDIYTSKFPIAFLIENSHFTYRALPFAVDIMIFAY